MKKWLLFDCMETIIDFEPLPTKEDYFDMGYLDSRLSTIVERNKALSLYYEAIEEYKAIHESHGEYPMEKRFEYIVNRLDLDAFYVEDLTLRFFNTYKSRCLVKEDKREVLLKLSKTYKLGVISDFMVEGGIESLLDHFDLNQYFDFVITSIGIGMRKPSFEIYQAAYDLCSCSKEDLVYIGDNYDRDYLGARAFGIEGIFYNPKGIKKIGNSIQAFGELLEKF